MTTIRRRTLIAAAGAATLAAPAVRAQGVSFAGQTIEWVIPFAEGGGSDVWARFLAPFLSRHMPGRPNVVIRNVPGGGSITGTNDFYQRARPDGLTFIGTSGSTQFPFLLGDRRVRYDYANMPPVIVSPTGGVVYLPARFNVRNASELGRLRGTELVYASQGATSLDLVPMLAFIVLGLNVRHVFGMRGRGEGRLALERGEATIDYQTSSAYLQQVRPMVERGQVVPLFSWGVLDAQGNVQRDPTFPDLPHFVEAYEMMHGRRPSGVEFNAYMAFFASGFAAQKPAMLPPRTPANIVQAYRQAFAAAVADPELQANKAEALGDYEQAVGDAVEPLYRIATTIDPAAREWARNFLATTYNVRFN
ncbi:MAG: tripartite tricarboxylate transporter substrate-binding protein [Acetobacteraceae bacterium]|nr:tripartite tricarboxylate transporter substrate-binding protein [Acetobacteraceae bacterium]MCX7684444.1 tripartite tricarboxylate transporter substrate-binding protein [Acetobacteraceae bacterium]MDW8398975.1 tripartite tricarboxylate transporter substrate-binding protein [Acetobacteraceae bacterium]